MARIRTIKPEFWTDDAVTECSIAARLFFIGTWNFADDSGNIARNSRQAKKRIFPTDALDCELLIQELITNGLLIEYVVGGATYLHIKGFSAHQVINRPSSPTCPPYMNGHDSLSTHAGREGKGREGSGKERRGGESAHASVLEPPVELDFETWKRWDAYRHSIGKPIKPASILAAQRKLSGYGTSQAEVVEQSIANGWQGLFELKVQNGKSKPTVKAKSIAELEAEEEARVQH